MSGKVSIIRKGQNRAEKEFSRDQLKLLQDAAINKKNSLSVWERNIAGPHYRRAEMQSKEAKLEVIIEELEDLI